MRLRRILTTCGLICVGLVLLYGVVVLFLIVQTPVGIEEWFRPRPRKPFSKEAWQLTRFGDSDRYRMANDLVSSRRLLGKTEQEAREMLGKASSEDHLDASLLIGYDLVSQRQFPAKCCLLPSFLFLNSDTWLLEVEIKGGAVKGAKIRFT
jgi:hypothetical protein